MPMAALPDWPPTEVLIEKQGAVPNIPPKTDR